MLQLIEFFEIRPSIKDESFVSFTLVGAFKATSFLRIKTFYTYIMCQPRCVLVLSDHHQC